MLRRCLQNLRMYTDVPYDLIIVEGLYDGFTGPIISELRKNDKHIKFKNNISIPKALNMVIRKAKTEYITLMSNDTFVQEGWFTELKKALDDTDYSFVGPLHTAYPHDQWEIIREEAKDRFYTNNSTFGFICLTGTTFKKDSWSKVGPFEEKLPFFYFDRDYQQQINDAGMSCGWVYKAVVTTLLNMTWYEDNDYGNERLFGKHKNYWSHKQHAKEADFFFKKWGRVP